MTKLSRFFRSESGAVPMDWIAMTAGVVLIAAAATYAVVKDGDSAGPDGDEAYLGPAFVSDTGAGGEGNGT